MTNTNAPSSPETAPVAVGNPMTAMMAQMGPEVIQKLLGWGKDAYDTVLFVREQNSVLGKNLVVLSRQLAELKAEVAGLREELSRRT